MKNLFQEAIRYGAVSACALIVDITVLFVLVHYLSWWYLTAATASFLVGLLFGYAMSITVVFKYRRIQNRCMEFAGFAGIGVGGTAINAAAMAFGVRTLGMNYLAAKCGAAGFTFVWNFLARRQFLFAKPRAA